MARVLEARRVLVQETEERRTLSPRPRSSADDSKGGEGTKLSTSVHRGLGNERGRRRGLQGVESRQEGEVDMPSGSKAAARPESPTSTITTKYSEIFGPDVQEAEVVSHWRFYTLDDI